MANNIRAFIAIELNDEARTELTRLEGALKKSAADVKWVEPRNIHLTLKFLGDIEAQLVETVQDILREVTKEIGPFDFILKEVGAFPSINSPRTIWIGIDRGKAELKRLADDLEDKLVKIGIPKEQRKFHPHVTLGRVRSFKNIAGLCDVLTAVKLEPAITIAPNYITLFKSELTQKGPLYSVLFKAKI